MKWLLTIAIAALGISALAQDTLRTAPPVVRVSPVMFSDSAVATVLFGMEEVEKVIWINGEESIYKDPLVVKESTIISASVKADGLAMSRPTHAQAIRASNVEMKWIDSTEPSDKYPDSGSELSDGIKAAESFSDDGWCGFDTDSVVFRWTSLGSIEKVGVSYLSDPRSWIMTPSSMKLTMSADKEVILERKVDFDEDATESKGAHLYIDSLLQEQDESVEYEFVLVIYPSLLPSDHAGAGQNAWVFIDEIMVER